MCRAAAKWVVGALDALRDQADEEGGPAHDQSVQPHTRGAFHRVDGARVDGMTAAPHVEPAVEGADGELGHPAAEPVRPVRDQIVLTITADQAQSLHRSIHLLVDSARRQLARRGGVGAGMTVDLWAVPPTPACASLLLLFRLLRQLLRPTSEIVVIGVTPALAPCLMARLPDGVLMVDQTGRRWPG